MPECEAFSLNESEDEAFSLSESDDEALIEPKGSFLKNVLNTNKRKLILGVIIGIVTVTSVCLILYLTQNEKIQYPSYSDIVKTLHTFSTDFTQNAKVINIGKSVNGRNISSISIKESESKKPLVWIVCGLHAREWTSPLTCLHFISNILKTSNNEEDDLLKSFRFKIVPVANPDGYEYSQVGYRLHRKNRRDSGCPETETNGVFDSSKGVDLNRNFPVGFTTHNNVCDDVYPGKEPFSEPETRALRDAFLADIPHIFLGIHGNAQALLTPLAYKYETAERKTLTIRDTSYKYGPASSVIYTVGGTMMDWVYEDLGVNRTFTLELKSLCDEDICHWQPDIEMAKKEIVPEAWDILIRILNRKSKI
eukprot:GFUD01044208.1.p1 GENE.GFUD01044208.1~~GFUD01044208.1.p1  ORF type:complete len:365 (+),score=66.01 GFUD01044208.1:102-1196(+)